MAGGGSGGSKSNEQPSVNTAPVLDNAIDWVGTVENENFRRIIPLDTFSDPDKNDTLTYTAHLVDAMGVLLGSGNLPTWLHFNASTRTFSGVPQDADVGVIYVRVTATDTGNLSVSDDFGIIVDNLIRGTKNDETLTALNGIGNEIYGLGGDDILVGGDSSDYLYGGAGDDILTGLGGGDHYWGGSGNDSLWSNSNGRNVFHYDSDTDGEDYIFLFKVTNSYWNQDVIDLSLLLTSRPNNTWPLITDYISFTDDGTSTTLEIDADAGWSSLPFVGGRPPFVTDVIIHLHQVTGVDLNTMIANGNIIL